MAAGTSYGSGYFAGDPVEAGLERARQHGIYVERADLEAPLSALSYVLDANWRDELSDRFVELLTENVTVASAARRFYLTKQAYLHGHAQRPEPRRGR
jgi:hypothetical protein